MERKRLGEMLVEGGVITEDELHRALELQKEDGALLGAILAREGLIDDDTLLEYLKLQGTRVHMHNSWVR